MPGLAMDDADVTSDLPAALRELIARQGLHVRAARELTSLRRGEGPRRTFCIELESGALVKGRTHREDEVTSRMMRWIPRIAPHGFAALRGAWGVASLEEWVAGAPLDPRDEDHAEAAGALLAACHGAIPCELLGADDPRLASWSDDCTKWIGEIRGAGHLDEAGGARIAERLRPLRPRAARWGLYHGDFSPENLVVGADGVRCVDNTTLRPQVLEIDPGFTVNRWPLGGAVRERFLRGYARHADPTPFLESERFWRIAAALRSAAYRVRIRAGHVELPLGELAGLVH